MALDFQAVNVPLVAGLSQKSDVRALQAPALLIAKDVQFDELGGIQTRHPTAPISLEVYGGGVLADIRRLATFGDEQLAFTKDALYSWSATLGKWVRKATHLAASTQERAIFATTGDQVDVDRAELGGVVFFSWEEGTSGVAASYVAAIDAATGAVILPPTAAGGYRVRLVALETRVLLLASTDKSDSDSLGVIVCCALDPAAPVVGGYVQLSDPGSGLSPGPYYDVAAVPGADKAVFVVSKGAAAAYTIGTVTAALAITHTSVARDSAGPIAVSVATENVFAQVLRGDAGVIKGDLLDLATLADFGGLVDVTVGTYGATLNQIAAVHRTVADGGQYRCYAFWSSDEAETAADWGTQTNWIDTSGAIGVEARLVEHVGVVSRAFDREGQIYVWLGFGGSSQSGDTGVQFHIALQNSYFLYRDDGLLVAKAVSNRAGGFGFSRGYLAGVQATAAGYAWCGSLRTRIDRTNFAAREPVEVVVTFDSDDARRCMRLGRTLYITSGEGLLQYDGRQITEVGFHQFPWTIGVAGVVSAGALDPGDYTYTLSYRWKNAQGESDRSASVLAATTDVAGGGGENSIGVTSIPMLARTHKAVQPIALEVWRTQVNPPDGAPLYLASSSDPEDVGAANNEYLENDVAGDAAGAFADFLADEDLTGRPQNPQNGTTLENVPPPPCTLIAASADRLFVAGVAGDPDRVWYSKLRGDGEVAAFHEVLTVAVPPEGGRITGLGFIDQTLVIHREAAIYALVGDGYDNTGGGSNYEARKLPGNVGAIAQESIAEFEGGQIFKSGKGWYRLTRGLTVEYIGGPVCAYDAEEVRAVHVLKDRHQIRCLTSGRVLVLDTLVGQWCEWTIADGVHAVVWADGYHYAAADAIELERDDYAGVDYGLDIETAWIKPADLQGFVRIAKILLLGEYRGAHKVRVRLARDYRDEYFQDKLWTVAPTTVGGPEQIKHGPSIQQCQAIKVRITACGADATADAITAPTTEALKLTGLALEVGLVPGLARNLSPAQQQ